MMGCGFTDVILKDGQYICSKCRTVMSEHWLIDVKAQPKLYKQLLEQQKGLS